MEKVALDTLELKKIKKQFFNYIDNHQIDINEIYKIAGKTHDMDQICLYYIGYIYNLFINELQLNSSKIFIKEQNEYNIELMKLIKNEFYAYAKNNIKEKIEKLPTLINNTNVINFINELKNNNDKVGDLTEPIPFDANNINDRDRPLILYQILDDNNNIIEENVIIGDYGTHHSEYTQRFYNLRNKVKVTFGYVYSDIVFLGNKEANECGTLLEVANIIKNKLPQITKVYHIPDEDNIINKPLERIADPVTSLLNSKEGISIYELEKFFKNPIK